MDVSEKTGKGCLMSFICTQPTTQGSEISSKIMYIKLLYKINIPEI